MDSYNTILTPLSGEITEKKSRFIATLAPAADGDAAREIVESVKKKYHDARHNCYVYIIGDKGDEIKYSDDGEPQGTAGRPMLEVLKGQGLTYICAVVTRYFGGVLLGTGGLSRAYSGALQEALKSGDITTMRLLSILECKVEYTLTGKLMNLFEKRGITINSTDYGEKVSYSLAMEPALLDPVIKDITEISGGNALLEKKGHSYAPRIREKL